MKILSLWQNKVVEGILVQNLEEWWWSSLLCDHMDLIFQWMKAGSFLIRKILSYNETSFMKRRVYSTDIVDVALCLAQFSGSYMSQLKNVKCRSLCMCSRLIQLAPLCSTIWRWQGSICGFFNLCHLLWFAVKMNIPKMGKLEQKYTNRSHLNMFQVTNR